MEAEPERIIAGRYALAGLLGTGGMASVHRAEDRFLGRTVAVKLFHADLTNAGDERRQSEEVSLLASLNHPALVTLFDAGRDSDDAFLVMEFVDGSDLRVRLTQGTLDSAEAAGVGADVASALAHIHARGVVHRDVKPANILLPTGAVAPGMPRAKLADFGIARLIDSTRLTATGTLIGTAAFLSPEQARGGQVGASTDIYSLSLLLLEALTGQRSFQGSAVESTMARLTRDPEIPDTLDRAWATLLRQGTARTPDDRPTAEEFASRLRGLSADAGTLVLPVVATEVPAADTPTELLSADAPTERLVPERTERLAPTTALPARPRSGRRRPAIIAAVILGLAAVGVVIAILIPRAAPEETPVTVQYPAVDGELGIHLGELQTSVEP